MLFIKYFNYYLVVMFLVTFSYRAMSADIESKCGDYVVKVRIKKTDILERQYKLYFQARGKKKKLIYKADRLVYFDVACIQNRKKRFLILFQEYYGGNVGPEDMYGIFDPSTNKMLINPSDWPRGNKDEVVKILGVPPPSSDNDDDINPFFCCDENQLDDAELN